MNPAPAEIAAGLSEAQRDIIISAPTGGEWFPVCWEGWGGMFRSLQRRGLAFPREPGAQALSPLGLAVRAQLLGEG